MADSPGDVRVEERGDMGGGKLVADVVIVPGRLPFVCRDANWSDIICCC